MRVNKIMSTFASHLGKCTLTTAFKVLKNAEIAQLVEHNLAKVGVAGPSPVFRSFIGTARNNLHINFLNKKAQVAELVDAHVSGACVERRAGSSPVLGTKYLVKLNYFL